MTDDELKAFIKAARQRAAPVGPLHALWDLIFPKRAARSIAYFSRR